MLLVRPNLLLTGLLKRQKLTTIPAGCYVPFALSNADENWRQSFHYHMQLYSTLKRITLHSLTLP